ncbi:Ig-like domain-containing protein [Serratia symbiotica]|uniref:Ig-like domain-containing protein n=1 Tax=Serratia symbiotica TaxID=138074 RepID=UPI00209092E8|nr:Ig-like domain-containing protein [Serratia symbiotica]USS96143.1 Ig-like domain-containing protein [Serratia symbiotica]
MLPAYQFKPGVNHYTVSGVAVDSQGNTSDPSETRVTVQTPLIDANSSTLTPRHSTLMADRKGSQLLTLVLKDIHMAVSALKSARVSAVTQKQAGVYQVTVTAGSEAESITLTPVLGNLTLGAAQVVISYSPPDGAYSTFLADRQSITADGQDSATLTFTAQDANGNPIAGLSHVTFMLLDGTPTDKIKLSTVTDKGNGVYQATLSGTRAGSYKVTPQVNSKASRQPEFHRDPDGVRDSCAGYPGERLRICANSRLPKNWLYEGVLHCQVERWGCTGL